MDSECCGQSAQEYLDFIGLKHCEDFSPEVFCDCRVLLRLNVNRIIIIGITLLMGLVLNSKMALFGLCLYKIALVVDCAVSVFRKICF